MLCFKCGLCGYIQKNPGVARDFFVDGCGLAFYSCDAGEDFALDGLEQCAAAGGDVRYLVGEAELVDASDRVAAAYE